MPAAPPPQASSGAKYKVADEVEVWSNTHKRWSAGTIEKVEGGGKLSVKYASPDGAAMVKQMPESHEHLRHRISAPARPAQNQASFAPDDVFKAGDKIEIWSNSQQAWCRGSIEKLEGELVNVKYQSPDGQTMTKLMPNGHEFLRHLQLQESQGSRPQADPMASWSSQQRDPLASQARSQHGNPLASQVAAPPPPAPDRSFKQAPEAQPMAESAGREESRTMLDTYGQACDDGMAASMRLQGSPQSNPMASHAISTQQVNAMKSKGHRATGGASPHHQAAQGQEDATFLAETATWAPSGGPMALCGMPMKANKKQEVMLNDDGTPIARCRDTDRCCRCSMPVGSYFEHTCPRCYGIVCLACLDDLKFVINSYRCPHCGDQHYNEDALKQTLWYIGVYRNAQRAVGAVPVLLAGLFGYGPEGAGRRNANQSCAMEDDEEPLQHEQQGPHAMASQAQAPPAAAKGGPPPAPPKPKAGARGAQGSQDVPEYHTRPPAGWAEGAGNWKPGGGSPPDPATVATAVHKAAAAQKKGPPPAPEKPVGHSQSGERQRAGSKDAREQQQAAPSSAGQQAPNAFASQGNQRSAAPAGAPQRGANPFSSGAANPAFSTRLPPDCVTNSPMR